MDVPAVIGGATVATADRIVSTDPAQPSAVVATSASCGSSEADEAVASCLARWGRWRDSPVAARAAVLFGAAEWMRARRPELAALEVYEAGKPWAVADADVCEAIDFCEYYGRQMGALGPPGPAPASGPASGGRGVGMGVQSPPGEVNSLHYQPRGVAAVIAPWNFPLAIAAGMVSAALVAGNAVCFKPAEQTPAIGAKLVEALAAGGLPAGVLAFLPGRGEEVGARLVAHPDVALIAFTGSKAVGLAINEAASRVVPGQRHVKRVIAEMGGKNALIVDGDADIDQAVPIILGSAFGFSGQKCSALSRLIVVRDVYDELVSRLVGAARVLKIGHPVSMGTDIGPLIDAEAQEKVAGYLPVARQEGTIVLQREDVPDEGWFVGPTIVSDVDPRGRLANEEIFGPVLSVFPVDDLDEALRLANATDYALTAGVLSRSPATIHRASAELRAGNVYVNRGITGAVVGRQPFGGLGLSGVGSKAGGPDYLFQFLEPRVVSENTLRQGFAATAE